MFLVKTSLVLLSFRLHAQDIYCYRNIFLFTKNPIYVFIFFVVITILCVLCSVTTCIIIIVQILIINATCPLSLFSHDIPFLFLLNIFDLKFSYATMNRKALNIYNNNILISFLLCLCLYYLNRTYTYHSLSFIVYFTYHSIPISSCSFIPIHIHYNAS